MVVATVRDGIYDFVLLLHLVAVVVGFGGVLLNGVYGAQAKKRPGPGGLAIAEANYFVSTKVAEPAIYLVPLFGFGLIGLSDSAWSFSQTWIVLSLVLYVIGLANARIVLVPTQAHMIALMREMAAAAPPAGGPPPQVAKMERAGRRLAAAGAFSHVLFTVIMVLMIWKPGL
jgi:uncharacterized membrane protein